MVKRGGRSPSWPARPCWECCLHRRVGLVAASIVIVAGVILLLGVAWFVHRYRNQRKWSMKDAAGDKSRWVVTSFHKPEFNEEDILSCLDEEVVGVGRTPSSDSKKQATPTYSTSTGQYIMLDGNRAHIIKFPFILAHKETSSIS
uniref:Uncharacterized protein n=1 Tax=Oryza meridionalis TaxID=40149 RepID=A0A0E0EMQ7_9ORYZ